MHAMQLSNGRQIDWGLLKMLDPIRLEYYYNTCRWIGKLAMVAAVFFLMG